MIEGLYDAIDCYKRSIFNVSASRDSPSFTIVLSVFIFIFNYEPNLGCSLCGRHATNEDV